MVSELLGISADGFAKRLFVSRPTLPEAVERLVMHDIRVAGTTVSLSFCKQSNGTMTQVIAKGAGLEVVVE
jgi:hypothetical protein